MASIRQLSSGKWSAQIRRRGKLLSHAARTKAAVTCWTKTAEVAAILIMENLPLLLARYCSPVIAAWLAGTRLPGRAMSRPM